MEDKVGVLQKFENAGTKFLLGSAYRMPPEALPRHADIVLAKDGIGGSAWQDIGAETTKEYEEIVSKAKTVVWSGPVGKAENAKYAKGSQALAAAIIKSKAFSVAGGGDTADFLQKEGLVKKFDWVSTGGGAMLAFLSGEKLPGILALEK
ncbi:MAG: phosphoglycerate kinase [bacterium]|nr:phosphoglycerate kinase [bacterium]